MSQWVVLELKPLTMNHAYNTNRQGRRFLVREGKRYKEAISEASRVEFAGQIPHNVPLTFEYQIHGPFLTLAGKWRKRYIDLDGCAKLLIDAALEPQGADDSLVSKIIAEKIIAVNWSVCFRVSVS